MTRLDEHPTVVRHRREPHRAPPEVLDAEWLRRLCLEAGADDVGFVAIDRPEIDDQRAEILSAFPATRTLVSFVCRLNREPIRSPARSVANQEFHHTTIARQRGRPPDRRGPGGAGVPAVNPADRLPDGDGPHTPAGSGSSRTSRSPSRPGWVRSASTDTSSIRSSAASSSWARSW